MIEYVDGILIEKSAGYVTVSCGGVGYGLNISVQTFDQLPSAEAQVSLWAHLSVREDSMTLYGFSDPDERDVFRLLIGLSGIGPKIALGILSGMELKSLLESIAAGDTARLVQLPGIGKKSAERLVLELKEKVSHINLSNAADTTFTDPVSSTRTDATAALIELGYSRPRAERAVSEAINEDETTSDSVERLIRAALRSSAK